MVSNKISKTDFSTHRRSPHIILRFMKGAITVAHSKIKMKKMVSIAILRHSLNKRANKMKRKRLRMKKKKKKRSHPSNYTTSTKKTKNSFSKDMDLLKINQTTCILFINKQVQYIQYLQHKSYISATLNRTLLSTPLYLEQLSSSRMKTCS